MAPCVVESGDGMTRPADAKKGEGPHGRNRDGSTPGPPGTCSFRGHDDRMAAVWRW